MNYNYYESVLEDVKEYIDTSIELSQWKGDRDGLEQKLNEDLMEEDSVTGNASRSYTFNAYEAEQNLVGNWDVLLEAIDYFADDANRILEEGPEYADVLIRCYYLPQAVADALDDLEDELQEDDDDLEDLA